MSMRPHDVDLGSLLWAIFLAEGGCGASVPFGYLRLREDWEAGNISAWHVLSEVIHELQFEYRRWRRAWATDQWPRRDVKQRDFIRWLARVGYNANRNEWVDWEKNVRRYYSCLRREAVKILAMGDRKENDT